MPNKLLLKAPSTQEAPKPETPSDVGAGWKIAALLTRLGSGALGSTLAIEPGLGSLAGAGIGGAGEAAAEYLEGSPISKSRIATEAGLSAIPMSFIFKEGRPVASALRGAAQVELGNVARRKAAGGDYLPSTAGEIAMDLGSTALGGGIGYHVGTKAQNIKPKAPAAPTGPTPKTVFTKAMANQPLTPAEHAIAATELEKTTNAKPKNFGELAKQKTEVEQAHAAANVLKANEAKAVDTASNTVETKLNQSLAPILRKKAGIVSDLDKGIADAQKVGTTNRKINLAVDVKTAKAEDAADLARMKETSPAAIDKAQGAAVKDARAFNKTEAKPLQDFLKDIEKEKAVAEKARIEQASRAEIQRKIDAGELEPGDTSVSESLRAKNKNGVGSKSASTRYIKPVELDEEGNPIPRGGGAVGNVPGGRIPKGPAFNDEFGTKDQAFAVAKSLKGKVIATRTGYRVVPREAAGREVLEVQTKALAPPKAEPVAAAPIAATPPPPPPAGEAPPPPTEPPAPVSPKPKKPKGTGPRGPNSVVEASAPLSSGLHPDVEAEIRRMGEEMDNFEFTDQSWSPTAKKKGTGGGDYDIYGKVPGAPVYHDIIAGGGNGSRGNVRAAISKVLAGGTPNNNTKSIEEVAKMRLRGEKSVSAPWLPPGAGAVPKASAALSDEIPADLSKYIDEASLDASSEEADKLIGKGKALEDQTLPGTENVRGTENPHPSVAGVKFPTAPIKGPSGVIEPEQASLLGSKPPSAPPPVEDLFAPSKEPIAAAPVRFSKSPLEAAGKHYETLQAGTKSGEIPEIPGVPRQVQPARVAGRAAGRLAKETGVAKDAATAQNLEADLEALKNDPSLLQKFLRGESGSMNPMTAIHLATGAGGAAIGAYENPDDPLTGGILGGMAGVAAPSAIQQLMKMRSGGGGGKGFNISSIVDRLPNWQRASLLSDPRNLAINTFAGPWGSGVMGSLEEWASGNPEGKQALGEMLNLPRWGKRFWHSLGEARNRIGENERADYTNVGPKNLLDTVMEFPAVNMTAGDMATRDSLMAGGMGEELAREKTLTSEPKAANARDYVHFGKAQDDFGNRSVLSQLMLPFKRTIANILAATPDRTPALGSLVNLYRASKGLPTLTGQEQLARQGIGTAVIGGAYVLGKMTPPEMDKQLKIHNLVSNLGGQYGLLAGAAFAAGQAAAAGTSQSGNIVKTIGQSVPLPSTSVIEDLLRPGAKVATGEPLTYKDIPQTFIPKIASWAVAPLARVLQSGEPSSTQEASPAAPYVIPRLRK